jgi:uncharacterized coiled-coil protein SlyX
MTKRRAKPRTTASKGATRRTAKAKPAAAKRQPSKRAPVAAAAPKRVAPPKRPAPAAAKSKATEAKPVGERLTALEVKLAYLEYTGEKLDSVIRLQQEQIDRLERRLVDLEGRPWEGTGYEEQSVPEEPPPHY